MSKGIIISPYHANSHRLWAEGIAAGCSSFDWEILALPPRFFRWRIRGNPLALLYEQPFADRLHAANLLVVTSMTDLATLKGLSSAVSQLPSCVYFHENQFAYPQNSQAENRYQVEAQMVTIYSALAADIVIFNSKYNRDTFLEGAQDLLRAFPDHAPLACVDIIAAKSRTLPVALSVDLDDRQTADGKRPSHTRQHHQTRMLRVVWNHRWEYDKGPDRLAKIVERCKQQNIQCEFYIIGQEFRKKPSCFTDLAKRFPQTIRHMGHIPDRNAYLDLLRRCDVVLSTALHDFQGLAVLEAISCGCVPLAPKRVAYPEFIPAKFLYASYPDNIDDEVADVVARLKVLCANFARHEFPQSPRIDRFKAATLIPKYSALFSQLMDRKPSSAFGE